VSAGIGRIQGVDTQAVKDRQTVTPSGVRIASVIDGVEFRAGQMQVDERGTLVEILSLGENSVDLPIVHVYMVSIRPGQVKGWVVHRKQDDRLFFLSGSSKVALYDGRVGSPTEGLVDVRFLGTDNRGLLVVPAGVYHALRNVGSDDVLFANLPTRAYDHADPDKFRLPAANDVIPYAI
jgi:dTDP-4-dehydrorhamnose 3,5-epimerase